MKHFLITRFHIDFGYKLSDYWFEKRLSIFENFVIPSIELQSDKDFIWILKTDATTPDWVREKLNRIAGSFYLDSSYCGGKNGLYPEVFSKIIRKITKEKEIITTSLDSDDLIASFHIRTVKDNFRPNYFFDFKRGLVKNKDGIYIHEKTKISQFYSFFEFTSLKPLTVYHKPHMTVNTNHSIINTIDLGWMQNNHSCNIMNGLQETKQYTVKASNEDLCVLKRYFIKQSLF
jgi:hypothetical protein